MSDLHAIANASELRQALQNGGLDRAEVPAIDLPPTDVGKVRLHNVRMVGTKLVGLHIAELTSHRVDARGVILRGTRFERAEMQNWVVSNSQAHEAQWPGARLLDCQFAETPLTAANLQRSMIVGCEFAQSDLNHANLQEALILHSRFTDARQGGAVLDNARLAGAVLCHVNLRGANLFRADFTGAVLVGVDLREANLVGAIFRDAVLIDVKYDRADMSGSTVQELAQALTGVADVFDRLKDHDPMQLAMVAATVLVRGGAQAQAQATPGVAIAREGADPLANLMHLSFAGLIRELQGRGGPQELGQMRVDGEHVYARSVGGDEVRITGAGRDAPRQAAQMRVPDPQPGTAPAAMPTPATGTASGPGAAPAAKPAGGRFSGLEID
ncbi:MAG: pentapeptide repeat-containing protein [Myxococcales bacterium]|nr:pentapeptide repeat-containing protein [Myxococcales bacterium]